MTVPCDCGTKIHLHYRRFSDPCVGDASPSSSSWKSTMWDDHRLISVVSSLLVALFLCVVFHYSLLLLFSNQETCDLRHLLLPRSSYVILVRWNNLLHQQNVLCKTAWSFAPCALCNSPIPNAILWSRQDMSLRSCYVSSRL